MRKRIFLVIIWLVWFLPAIICFIFSIFLGLAMAGIFWIRTGEDFLDKYMIICADIEDFILELPNTIVNLK